MMTLLPTRFIDSLRPSGSSIGWNMSVSTPAVMTLDCLGSTPSALSSSRMGVVNETTASERLSSCLDRAISADYGERMAATREAQEILARMSEQAEKQKERS